MRMRRSILLSFSLIYSLAQITSSLSIDKSVLSRFHVLQERNKSGFSAHEIRSMSSQQQGLSNELDPDVEDLSQYGFRDFLRNCAVILLAVCIFALAFKILHKTTYCRRRHADIASKREERRARRAYKSAARRLKWRQWWDRTPPTPSAHDHALEEGEQFENESNSPDGIHDEILDFRQTLNYVGELVRKPTVNTPKDANYTSSTAHKAPSSIISLDTMNTVETDTAPPSYRS